MMDKSSIRQEQIPILQAMSQRGLGILPLTPSLMVRLVSAQTNAPEYQEDRACLHKLTRSSRGFPGRRYRCFQRNLLEFYTKFRFLRRLNINFIVTSSVIVQERIGVSRPVYCSGPKQAVELLLERSPEFALTECIRYPA